MTDIEKVKKQEAVLRERLSNDGRISLITKNFNQFVDTIFVIANLTNESLTLNVYLTDETICFWNDCDEKFVYPMDNQSIDCIVDALNNEFEQVYYFRTNSQAGFSYIEKITETVDAETLKNKAAEIHKYGNETFDCIEVHNFIGSKRYRIVFYGDEMVVE